MRKRPILLLAMLAMLAQPIRAQPAGPASATRDAWPSTYRPLPRADTLIAGATLLDGAGGRMDDADILVREGRIAAVGRRLPREGVTVVEARGRWVTPGIIDVHSHNGTYALPLTAVDVHASDVAELSDPNAADIWIEHAVNVQDPAFFRALASGVTTLQILPGSLPVFGGRSVILKTVPATTVAAMKFPDAPMGLKMACGENPKGFFGGKGREPTSRAGVVAMMRAAFQKARGHMHGEERKEGGKGGDRRGPKPDLKMETLAGVLAGDIRVHIHCYRADDMATMIGMAREAGFRIASFQHAVEAYKIAGLLRDEGICAAVWPDWWGFKVEASDAIPENAAFVDAAGGCAMMHSDSPILGQRLAVAAGKAAAAGRRAGLPEPPERAIRWVTSNPAKSLGLDDRIGTIAPGHNADIVIWSADPFSIQAKADQVYIDGALAYDRADPARRPRSDFELGRPAMQEPRR